MQIVRQGNACCGVDVLPDAPPPVLYAAEELIRFLKSKTGCELPRGEHASKSIVLRLASDSERYRSDFSGMPATESYIIDADENHLYLVGADPAGLVYAVFDFINDEADVGFAGLGELGVRLSPESSLDVHPRKRQCSPQIAYRGFTGGILEDAIETAGGLSPLHLQRLDWMAQNRMNYYVLDPGVSTISPNDFRNVCRLLPEVKRRGLKVQWGHHCWMRWVPPDRYFDEHPEYYALINGGRRGDGTPQQLCLCTSNPAVARVMAENILRMLEEFPEVDVVSLWPEDGTGMCECDACQKLDILPEDYVTDAAPGKGTHYTRSRRHPNKTIRYARFVNEVARHVGEVRADVLLSAVFYHDIDAPPKGVTLEPNIQPCLTHYWRCWRHPLDHPDCENGYYNRITSEWAELYPGRLVIYEYFMGMSCYSSLPWPLVPTMHSDWRRYIEMGIQGAVLQSQGAHFTVYGPTYSAFARMSWNLNASIDEVAHPYFDDLYEEASEPIRRMVGLLENRFVSEEHDPENLKYVDSSYRSEFRHCLFPVPDAVARFLDAEAIAEIDSLMQEAEALASQPRTRANVAKVHAAVNYWRMAFDYFSALGRFRQLVAEAAPQANSAGERCLCLCEEIIGYIDLLPYPDVVSREMVLRIYWPTQHKQVREQMV
ncbi:MAG: hypothetical protein COS85_10485 [Armatimonadetes bacterium CG07_land_8_20_14_0_80_59_28]|nr:MAG: hypothetical protein COS85_10485 [Armatimonadetes bacterium CG07_land_8_20_14_0_80_59_28]PIX38989.1 MAG: hypothetical protein COZ56_19000 [Armatimonadetes bacterium CG_4_8_14_3_um_filter_58_9]PIY38757.1 MAG: hypothetical protein COZ05_20285 [Armatimonadetes bacterium CG_4_10_14_3_um_filter_59_10]